MCAATMLARNRQTIPKSCSSCLSKNRSDHPTEASMKRFIAFAAFLLVALPLFAEIPVHTFSIVARDPQTGEIGVAVQSHYFFVGGVGPLAEAGGGGGGAPSFFCGFFWAPGVGVVLWGGAAPRGPPSLGPSR